MLLGGVEAARQDGAGARGEASTDALKIRQLVRFQRLLRPKFGWVCLLREREEEVKIGSVVNGPVRFFLAGSPRGTLPCHGTHTPPSPGCPPRPALAPPPHTFWRIDPTM